ncbi:MAG: hypothetical protein L0Z54_04165 [Thermoplasmata archaeon]|nr:hypothetical protein [Thermoplasmata archaeon]
MGLRDLVDSMRADWWSALALGVLVYLLLSPLAIVPLYIGPVLMVSLAPYLSARASLADTEKRRTVLGGVMGLLEAVILIVVVHSLLSLILGSVYVSTLEGLLAGAALGLSAIFGALGAASLEHSPPR